jgi:hypothetical protein
VGLRQWDDQSDCEGGEWRLRPLKLTKAWVEGG